MSIHPQLTREAGVRSTVVLCYSLARINEILCSNMDILPCLDPRELIRVKGTVTNLIKLLTSPKPA